MPSKTLFWQGSAWWCVPLAATRSIYKRLADPRKDFYVVDYLNKALYGREKKTKKKGRQPINSLIQKPHLFCAGSAGATQSESVTPSPSVRQERLFHSLIASEENLPQTTPRGEKNSATHDTARDRHCIQERTGEPYFKSEQREVK